MSFLLSCRFNGTWFYRQSVMGKFIEWRPLKVFQNGKANLSNVEFNLNVIGDSNDLFILDSFNKTRS